MHTDGYVRPINVSLTYACVQALDDAASFHQVDPYEVVQPEVRAISERLRHSVSSTVPALKQAAEYFFRWVGTFNEGLADMYVPSSHFWRAITASL